MATDRALGVLKLFSLEKPVWTAEEAAAQLEVSISSAYRYLSRKYRAWWLWPLRLVLRAGLSVRARWVTRK